MWCSICSQSSAQLESPDITLLWTPNQCSDPPPLHYIPLCSHNCPGIVCVLACARGYVCVLSFSLCPTMLSMHCSSGQMENMTIVQARWCIRFSIYSQEPITTASTSSCSLPNIIFDLSYLFCCLLSTCWKILELNILSRILTCVLANLFLLYFLAESLININKL